MRDSDYNVLFQMAPACESEKIAAGVLYQENTMLIDTYIVRLYRQADDEADLNEVIGVVEVAGQEKKHYFNQVEELPVILNQLSKPE